MSVLRRTSTAGVRLELLNLHLTAYVEAGVLARQLPGSLVGPFAFASSGNHCWVCNVCGRRRRGTAKCCHRLVRVRRHGGGGGVRSLFPEFAEVLPHGFARAQDRAEDGGPPSCALSSCSFSGA